MKLSNLFAAIRVHAGSFVGALGLAFAIISPFIDSSNPWKYVFSFIAVIFFVGIFYWIYDRLDSRDMKMFFTEKSNLWNIFIHNSNNSPSLPSFDKIAVHNDVQSHPLSKHDKRKMCIIQIGFIITDTSNRVLVVRRKGRFHLLKKHKRNVIISFSPFPARYNQDVKILDIYHREIPSTMGCEPKIRRMNTPIIVKNYTYFRHYIFYLYKASYNLSFVDSKGNTDQKTLRSIFFENGNYFKKDHDEIVGFFTLDELRCMQSSGDIQGFADKEAIDQIISSCISDRGQRPADRSRLSANRGPTCK